MSTALNDSVKLKYSESSRNQVYKNYLENAIFRSDVNYTDSKHKNWPKFDQKSHAQY